MAVLTGCVHCDSWLSSWVGGRVCSLLTLTVPFVPASVFLVIVVTEVCESGTYSG